MPCKSNGGSKLFNQYASPMRLGDSPPSQWEGVPTKDAGNQRIAKSVMSVLKGSTKIEHVTLLGTGTSE